MTIAFTICSNNYISQAKALGVSLEKHNPEIKFIIVLADEISNIPSEYRKTFDQLDIIEVKDVGIPNLAWMHENYDIIEFNTAIKPYFFKYLLEKEKGLENIVFLDPDIYIYQKLSHITDKLKDYNILLTPHLTRPIEDDRNQFYIHEAEVLNHGVFNLGYVAINTSSESKRFIDWWCERLKEQCKHDLCNGLFVDQLWCNLAPSYFDKVYIDKHLGLNMAYWNLQERVLSKSENKYVVNEKFDLIFFHFSNFDPRIENNIAQKQNRFDLSTRTDLVKLYQDYELEVKSNHYQELKSIPCSYGTKPKPVKRYKRIRAALTKPLKWTIKVIEETI
jgi:hypothetical protein